MAKHGEIGKAAMRAAMSENTARKYLAGEKLPSEMRPPRNWRTRDDPFDEDWDELVTYLGGEDAAGGKLKSKRTDPVSHPRWDSPNSGATDGYYFSALPGGFRSFLGWYDEVGYSATWWSSTEFDASFAVTRSIYNEDESIERAYRHKRSGFSVRCIQD